MAMGMQFLILGWLVLELTNSASLLGLVIFVYGIPNMAMLIFGGVFADRVDRRTLLIVSQSVVALIVALIAILAAAQLASIWHIFAVALVLGAIQGINMPARMAIVPNLVDKDDIMNATALTQSVMNSGRIMGPAMAGWIIDYAGIGNALYFNTFCYAIGVLFLFFMKGVQSQTGPVKSNIAQDFAEGVFYVWKTPVALTLILMSFGFGFFAASHVQVLPAFAKEVLGANAGRVGLLISASGFGSLAGSLVLASLGNVRGKNWLLLAMALLFASSLLLFAWSPIFSLTWVILLFVGLAFSGYISMATAILQLTVPSHLLGRIMSMLLIAAALHYIGALPLGLIADNLSWPISISYGALSFLLVVLVLGVWRPNIRRLRV